MMNLCLHAGHRASVALDTAIRAAAQAGFVCLNLWAPGLEATLAIHPISWLDDLFQTYGLYPVAISGLEPLSLRPRADYVLFQSYFVDLCSRLDSLGGGLVVVALESMADQPGMQAELEGGLQKLSALAIPFDVRIAVDLQGAASSPSPQPYLGLSKKIVSLPNLPNVGIALNVKQVRLNDKGLDELDALPVEKLWLVDLRDSTAQNDPLAKKVCRHLADRGFQGPYSVELVCQENNLEQTIRATRQAALELFQP